MKKIYLLTLVIGLLVLANTAFAMCRVKDAGAGPNAKAGCNCASCTCGCACCK